MSKATSARWKLGDRRNNTESFTSYRNSLAILSKGHQHLVSDLVKTYGSPLQIFLPGIVESRARRIRDAFDEAMKRYGYRTTIPSTFSGRFQHHYPLKANQRQPFVEAAVRGGCELETSSEVELALIRKLYASAGHDRPAILCNGPKSDSYRALIARMHREGWNIMPIANDEDELRRYLQGEFGGDVGVRVDLTMKKNSGHWHKKHNYYGIAEAELAGLPVSERVVLLHYHLTSQVEKIGGVTLPIEHALTVFAKLKRGQFPNLSVLNFGGGAGIPYTKSADHYTTEELVNAVVKTARDRCDQLATPPPLLMCEWGQHLVAPAQLTVFEVRHVKRILDPRAEATHWFCVNGSFMSHLPDTWGVKQKWHVTPVTNLNAPSCVGVWFSGSSCDSDDQCPREEKDDHGKPKKRPAFSLPLPVEKESFHVAFFDTGAYQNALGSYHCLLPSPVRIMVEGDEVTLLHSRESARAIGKKFDWHASRR